MLLTLLDPELGTEGKFSEHRGFEIVTYGNSTLVDIRLGNVFGFLSNFLRSNISQYKAVNVKTPAEAEERANLYTRQVFQSLIHEIEQLTNIQDAEADPLVVQLLKASTFNRAVYNINQLIKQTNEAETSLAPLIEFLSNSGFPLRVSITEKRENQRLLALFNLQNHADKTHCEVVKYNWPRF